jgi:hypothetical protein
VQSFDRTNQFDVTVAKWVTMPGGKVRIQPELSLFNALNVSSVLGVGSLNFGTASYQQPTAVIRGRIVRIGAQIRW